MRQHGLALGIKPFAVPEAYAIAYAFYTVVFLGYFIAHFRPEIIRRYFAV